MNLVNDIYFDSIKPLAFIVFDFETLTAYSQNLDAIELGAVTVPLESMKIETEFSHLIKPLRIQDFNQFAIDLTGIRPEDVKDAKSREEVLKLFEEYSDIYQPILIAQNAIFDHSILKKNLDGSSNLLKAPCLDLIKLVRFVNSDLKSYNLDSLANHYSIPVDSEERHRGLYDSVITAEVLIKVIKQFEDLGINNLSRIIKIGKINKFTPETQIGLFG